jgi:hypothetical protein
MVITQQQPERGAVVESRAAAPLLLSRSLMVSTPALWSTFSALLADREPPATPTR